MREPTQEERLWLWLHSVTGIYARTFYQLIAPFESVQEVFELAAKGVNSAFEHVGDELKSQLMKTANQRYIDRYCNWLNKHEVDVCIANSDRYPALLKEIYDAPPVLFVKGRLNPEPKLPIAMVGSRKCTEYGKTVAKHFAYELACRGVTIVSGMAYGVDKWASVGALECPDAQDPTIVVLGCGIDRIYPKANEKLYYDAIERGAVITEFRPGTPPEGRHFPIRNRIISGLARGTVVVEAAAKSGASITANQALEQGREVFAVPGRITDFMSVGTNQMIKEGMAKPVFTIHDILEEFPDVYDYEAETASKEAPSVKIPKPVGGNQEIQQAIIDQLCQGEKSFDELCENLNYSPAEINSALTQMCFSGIMKQLPGRIYDLQVTYQS